MMTIKFIRHADCSEEQLLDICKFKNLNWNYPIDSHRNWLDNNLADGDTHLLLFENQELIGYLNIVNVDVLADSTSIYALGIGNVCIHPEYKGNGLGALIMSAAKYFCRKNDRMGILLCQDKNAAFYDACGWQSFKGSVTMPGHHNSMHINLYSTKQLKLKNISFNRDF